MLGSRADSKRFGNFTIKLNFYSVKLKATVSDLGVNPCGSRILFPCCLNLQLHIL